VRLIAAQFFKPCVKSSESDFNDAEAIAEAGTPGTMRFVMLKHRINWSCRRRIAFASG
jgi:hypothetical protein